MAIVKSTQRTQTKQVTKHLTLAEMKILKKAKEIQLKQTPSIEKYFGELHISLKKILNVR